MKMNVAQGLNAGTCCVFYINEFIIKTVFIFLELFTYRSITFFANCYTKTLSI